MPLPSPLMLLPLLHLPLPPPPPLLLLLPTPPPKLLAATTYGKQQGPTNLPTRAEASNGGDKQLP